MFRAMLGGIVALLAAFLIFKFFPSSFDSEPSYLEHQKFNERSDEPIYVTFACGTRVEGCPYHFGRLDDMIGSLHQFRNQDQSSPTVHVFCYKLTNSEIQILHTWQGVIYHHFDYCFPELQCSWLNSTKVKAGRRCSAWTDGTVKDLVIRRMLGDYSNVVYVNAEYVFNKYIGFELKKSLHENGHVQILNKDEVVLEGVGSLKELMMPPSKITMTEMAASKPFGDPNLRCSILLRKDFPLIHQLSDSIDFQINSDTIVLGVPTTSKKTKKIEDHPLTMILMPSLLETVTMNPQCNFVLLIGFDAGDKFFDNQFTFDFIKNAMSHYSANNLLVHFIRLPRTGAVTVVWNMLYEVAMKAGAQYFYQLNDDITFKNHTWPAVFTKVISENNGYGIVGPKDKKFGCKLMTQNFVGRGHYNIYGYLFPPDLHNWFSDTWLNIMYGNLGLKYCDPLIGIVNGGRRDGPRPRYMACKQSDHSALLNRLQDQAETYLLNHNIKIKYK